MEPAWDFATLRAWFLARPGEDVAETDLLRAFFPGEDPFDEGVSLSLFHKHFLLYRRLWVFDDELRHNTGERLWIRGIRATLLAPPPHGACAWLDEATGRYCLARTESTLCGSHEGGVPDLNSLKSYYLDWSHLTDMTEEGVQDLVQGFFRWLGRRPAVTEALVALGLRADATPAQAKRRWKQVSLEHHPDRGGDQAQFQRFSAAWAVLKNGWDDLTSSASR